MNQFPKILFKTLIPSNHHRNSPPEVPSAGDQNAATISVHSSRSPMTRKTRGRQGRSAMSSSAMDRLLLTRIANHMPDAFPSDAAAVVDHLRSRFPEYGRIKLHPFTRLVQNLLADLHNSRNGGNADSMHSSVSVESVSCSSESDGADLEPGFDVTKAMLQEGYLKQARDRIASAGAAGRRDDVGMEIENAANKPKRKVLKSVTPVKASNPDGGGGMVIEPPRFKDFGGIKDVIDKLIDDVIVPILQPRVYREIGVKPTTGILFHGPPGCGKTRLSQAIANEAGVPFYQISSTQVVSSASGESEEYIRNLFEKAYRTAPSIIFIDEIDAIASKRKESSQKEMGTRIVSQLLTCMDESHQTLRSTSDSEASEKKSGHVLVIGATNRVDVIDPALRRPGRFDEEILLGVPDEKARKEMLTLFTRYFKLAGTFDIEKVAKLTHGFVGADLRKLVDVAGKLSIERFTHKKRDEYYGENDDNDEIAWAKQSWTDEEVAKINVTMYDFEEAAKRVQPALKRKGFSSIPNITWEDVGGLESIRRAFDRYIVQRIKDPEKYENVTSQTGFLLYGPPGCGKTLVAQAVANEAGANFIYIKGPELLSKYVGDSEKEVRTIFTRARTCSPCIIFFDEIDALTLHRGNGRRDGGRAVESVCEQILIELNGADDQHGVYVIGATNRPEAVDPALLRPRRLGKRVYVPLPNEEQRVSILKSHTRKISLADDVDLETIGRVACKDYSGADIEELVNEAVYFSIDDMKSMNSKGSLIKACHFEKALKNVSPSVEKEKISYYEALSRRFK